MNTAPIDLPTYKRARAEGTPAKQAYALARWIAAPKLAIDPNGSPTVIERDGFTVTLRATYDEGMALDDVGYGAFENGYEDDYGHLHADTPGAIPTTGIGRDSRSPSGGAHFYIPVVPREDRIAWARKEGASRSVALDMAREAEAQEMAGALGGGYGPTVLVLTAKAAKEGITLGTHSVGGIAIEWSDTTRTDGSEYLAEIAEDIIPEAIAEAREALERLVTA